MGWVAKLYNDFDTASPVAHFMLEAAWVVLSFKLMSMVYRFWKWTRK